MRWLILVLALAILGPPAAAQPAFPPGYAEAQAAFQALPEEERKAIQAALVWTGDYSGLADGEFGRLTFQGLANFQRRQRAPRPDAILSQAQRRALAQAAGRVRAQLRFEVRADERSGTRVGLPMALIDGRANAPAGSRWTARDGRFQIETMLNPGGQRELSAVHARLTQPDAGRSVTYQVLRPDFLVVSGEDDRGRSYTRIVRRGADIVGFSVRWDPDRLPDFERVVFGINNAFEPGGSPPAAPPGPVAGAPQTSPAPTGPAQVAAAPPSSPPPPARPQPQPVAATALLLGGGLAVAPETALGACPAALVGGRPARLERRADGLALLAVEVSGGAALTLAQAPADGARLAFVAQGAGGVSASPTDAARSGDGALAPELPVQPGQSGGALIDGGGRLVGVVLGPRAARVASIAGVVPASPQRVVDARVIASLAGRQAGPPWNEAMGAFADVVLRARDAVQPLTCRR